METDKNFMKEGLTFDDVLLVPSKSYMLPRDVNVSTKLTKNIQLNVPVVSAAMDTVTESKLAIAIALEGGIGIIHRNLPIKSQVEEVDKVKRYESVMIVNPVTLTPQHLVKDAHEVMKKYQISGVPITQNGRLVGILTSRDLKFVKKGDLKISAVMTKNVISAPLGTTLTKIQNMLHENRIEKLPIVDKNGNLKGLITMKDIQKKAEFPNACKDKLGRLRAGAAIGVGNDMMERLKSLVQAEVDVIVVDTAHGHSFMVLEALKQIKKKFPKLELIAGNVATAEATVELIKLGVDAVKVGIGPGSICTTRVVAGIGVPQFTAIYECSKSAKKYGVPIIADGGIKFSGDIVKALAAGASSVMIGNLFAGTDESPGEVVLLEGRRFKVYYGMGSLTAMKKGSKDRYFQEGEKDVKLVPEGVEGRVPYRGSMSGCILQLVGGLKAGMSACNAKIIKDLQKNAKFIRITSAGLTESHAHNITITSEPPNYWLG